MKLLLLRLKSQFKRPLPKGMTEFNQWVADIVALSGLPDNASTRRVAATFILHTPSNVSKLSLKFVVSMLQKAAANQVAAQVVKDYEETKGLHATGSPEAQSPMVQEAGKSGV